MNEWSGLNFRNETLWRGRMLASTYVIRNAILEVGGWLAAIVLAYQLDRVWPDYYLPTVIAAVACVRMFSNAYGDWRKLSNAEEETEEWMNHIEKLDNPRLG